LRYYIKEEDIEMDIKDWQYDWRVPVQTQEMPTDKEDDVGKDQIPVGNKDLPKKPNPSLNMEEKNKGGVPKKGMQIRKRTPPRHQKNNKKGL
jgi:hypothetical protein